MFIAILIIFFKNCKQMSFNIDKETMIHPHSVILLSNKKEQTTDTCNDLDERQRNCTEWKKKSQKDAWCMSPHM